VQTRLLACLAGGFLGVVVASPISDSFGLTRAVAFIACPLIGLAIGYAASIFFDVFTAGTEDEGAES
jgi:uncharacterized membrane protein YuzA (DUF378 family)